MAIVIHSREWPSHMLQHLNDLRKEGYQCDMVVRTHDKVFLPVHSCVLAASSPELKRIIDAKRRNSSEISVKEYSADLWQSLIEFIYVGKTSVPLPRLPALLEMASYLQLDRLARGVRAALRHWSAGERPARMTLEGGETLVYSVDSEEGVSANDAASDIDSDEYNANNDDGPDADDDTLNNSDVLHTFIDQCTDVEEPQNQDVDVPKENEGTKKSPVKSPKGKKSDIESLTPVKEDSVVKTKRAKKRRASDQEAASSNMEDIELLEENEPVETTTSDGNQAKPRDTDESQADVTQTCSGSPKETTNSAKSAKKQPKGKGPMAVKDVLSPSKSKRRAPARDRVIVAASETEGGEASTAQEVSSVPSLKQLLDPTAKAPASEHSYPRNPKREATKPRRGMKITVAGKPGDGEEPGEAPRPGTRPVGLELPVQQHQDQEPDAAGELARTGPCARRSRGLRLQPTDSHRRGRGSGGYSW